MTTREQALEWYGPAYAADSYKMGEVRKAWAQKVLYEIYAQSAGTHPLHSYFEIGCGRGEMLQYADTIGFDLVRGCETVPDLLNDAVSYGLAHDVPAGDKSFDVVTMFDVMEHLTESDCIMALAELKRIAKHNIILSISNRPSIVNGVDVHITKKTYEQWDGIIRLCYSNATVTHLVNDVPCVCEMWRIDL